MKHYRRLILSFVLSFLVLLVPWEAIRSAEFSDRMVYLDYVYYQTNVIEYKDFDSYLSFFTGEWLWHYILLNVDSYISYESFFYLISLLTLSLMVFYLVRKHSLASSLLLINPLILDLVLSQYRICLALCFVLLSIFVKHKYISIMLFICAMFIHSSIGLLLLIYFTMYWILRLFSDKKNIAIFSLMFLGIIVSWLLSGYVYTILSFLNDRRAEYDIDRVSSSVSYLIFWFLNLLVILFFFLKRGRKNISEEYGLSIISLSFISANIIFGGYSTRIIAVFLPSIMSSNLYLNKKLKILILGIYFFYCAIQWSYWLKW